MSLIRALPPRLFLWPAAAVAASLALVGLVGPGALPAAAHGGAGAISLIDTRPTGERSVAVEVCVTYTLDRDQADSARVTVRAEGPGDAGVATRDMDVGDQPGLRNATLDFPRPGSWTVIVESAFPPAQLVVPITVGGGGDRASPAATAPGPANVAAACEPAGREAPTWLVAGGASAAAVIGFGGLLFLLRRRTAPPA